MVNINRRITIQLIGIGYNI